MTNLTTFCRHHQDEPVLQQNENNLEHLSFDKTAIATAALYEATKPSSIYFDYIYVRCPYLNKSIALLGKLSLAGKLAVARAIAEELAVLEQLQGAIG